MKSENLFTNSRSHLITGYKFFNNTITVEDVNVAGAVVGVVISPNTILLSTGHQVINGAKHFGSLNTTWLKADDVKVRIWVNSVKNWFWKEDYTSENTICDLLIFIKKNSVINFAKKFRFSWNIKMFYLLFSINNYNLFV